MKWRPINKPDDCPLNDDNEDYLKQYILKCKHDGGRGHYNVYQCSASEMWDIVCQFDSAKYLDETEQASPDAHEKEVMMQAFDKVRKIFEQRTWIMEGRGSYPYNDDRYKEEVWYLFDEFEAIKKDTWANIESKSFEYRKQIIDDYLKGKSTAASPDAKPLIDLLNEWQQLDMRVHNALDVGRLHLKTKEALKNYKS